MNAKWSRLLDGLEKLLILHNKIADFTFLPSSKWHIETNEEKEVLVIAEDRYCENSGMCLVVDLEGNMYVATIPSYKILQYCSNSLSQFIAIAEQYFKIYEKLESPSIFDEAGMHHLEIRENEFRSYIMQVDPTALMDENSFWSVCAEEMGYGF